MCSLKLRRELLVNANHPANTNFAISDGELDDYRTGHTAKPSSRFYGPNYGTTTDPMQKFPLPLRCNTSR